MPQNLPTISPEKMSRFAAVHAIVGQIVLHAIELGVELESLSLQEMQKFAPEIEEDVFEAILIDQTLNSKNAIGGTSPSKVAEALLDAKNYLKELEN